MITHEGTALVAEHAKHDLIYAENTAAPGDEPTIVQMTWAKFLILSKGENTPWKQVQALESEDQAEETTPAPAPAITTTPARTARPATVQEKENA